MGLVNLGLGKPLFLIFLIGKEIQHSAAVARSDLCNGYYNLVCRPESARNPSLKVSLALIGWPFCSKKSCASLSVSVPLHYGFVQKPAVCTGIDLLMIIFRRIAYYIWGYLGYVLKFQTHIDMLTCLLFRKCLGGRPNLEEIFCQSQHPSDINPGLTNPLLIRMISTVISMGFQVISCYIGVSFSMFVQLMS